MKKSVCNSVFFKSSLLAGVCALTMGGGSAFAGAFGLHEQSAEALGASFAGVAAGSGGLSAMFWNPATLTQNGGFQVSTSGSLLIPSMSDKNTTAAAPISALPSPGNMISPVLLPAGYLSYQINDQFWVGLSLNTPFGLSTKNPVGTAPALWGLTTSVFSENITPQIAYRLNDWISIGAGLQVEYFEVRETNQDASAALLGGGFAADTLKGNSWGVGFTLGVDLKPMDGTDIGIGYRSQVREGLKGSLSAVANVLPLPGVFLVPFSASVSAPLTLPDSISVGLRQRITPTFTLLAGVEWTDWSRVQTLTVTTTSATSPAGILATGTPIIVDQLKYKDGWMFSLGGEYKWSDAITLRAGGAYEISPISNSNRDVRLLDSNRVWLSLGASYKVSSKLKFDISYAHIFYASGTVNIPAGSTTPALPLGYTGASSARGDVISVGLTYRFDDPVKAVIAKY